MKSSQKLLTAASALILLTAACSSTRQPLGLTPAIGLVGEHTTSASVTSSVASAVEDEGMPNVGSSVPTGTEIPSTLVGASSPFASRLVNDAQYVAGSPFRWDRSAWMKAGVAAAVVGGTMLLDETARDAVSATSSAGTNSFADAIEPFGAEYSWGVLGAFYLSGRYLRNDRAAAVARDGLTTSLIAAGAITPLLKVAVGRSRPSQTEGTFVSEGGRSFPSGHTTQAFALASVIASHYRSPWVKAAAYGLAGAVGWARMENNAHYASDVVAGALIGTLVGKTVVKLHGSDRVAFKASPSLDPNAPGVALTLRASSSDVLRLFKRRR